MAMEWNGIQVLDDSDYKPSEDDVPLRKTTPGTSSSSRKNHLDGPIKKNPLSLTHTLGLQNLTKQKTRKKVENLDKEDNEIKLDTPLNMDPNETKDDEIDVDKLLGKSMMY